MDLAQKRLKMAMIALVVALGLTVVPAGPGLAQSMPKVIQTQWKPPKPDTAPGQCSPGSGTEYCECACYSRSLHGRTEYGDGAMMPFPNWTICRDTCRVKQCKGFQTLDYDGNDASEGRCKNGN